jgi:hypothetical protein
VNTHDAADPGPALSHAGAAACHVPPDNQMSDGRPGQGSMLPRRPKRPRSHCPAVGGGRGMRFATRGSASSGDWTYDVRIMLARGFSERGPRTTMPAPCHSPSLSPRSAPVDTCRPRPCREGCPSGRGRAHDVWVLRFQSPERPTILPRTNPSRHPPPRHGHPEQSREITPDRAEHAKSGLVQLEVTGRLCGAGQIGIS